jgi:hypothetical protein
MKGRSKLDRLIQAIDDLVELPPSELPSANERAAMIAKITEDLQNFKLDIELSERLRELTRSFNSAAARLSQSASNSKSGPLRADWERLARRDLIAVKDEALALHEFLSRNYERLRSAIERAGAGGGPDIDLRKLVEELRGERAVRERTWVLFVGYLGKSGRSWRRELQDGKVLEQLMRISSWLSDLKELRGVGDVQPIEGA